MLTAVAHFTVKYFSVNGYIILRYKDFCSLSLIRDGSVIPQICIITTLGGICDVRISRPPNGTGA